MRGRSGLLLTVGAFVALLLVAALLGRQQRGVVDEDQRASTYVEGPGGTSGLYEALPALGVRVSRMRERPRAPMVSANGRGAVLLVLAPTLPVTAEEAAALLGAGGGDTSTVHPGPDVVLAGAAAASLMRCLRYRIRPLLLDSARVAFANAPGSGRPFFVRAVLDAAPASRSDDEPPSPFRMPSVRCPKPAVTVVDTLATSTNGAVVLRVSRAGNAPAVVLVSDESLFRNRRIRDTQAGPFVLAFLARRYDHVIFDEYHHGFGPSGSLGRVLMGWSLRSPLGWTVWQAATVGLLALLAAAVRFGPPEGRAEPRRRASFEHVRALATALAAARGHDVAIAALVQGLRRRLTPHYRLRRTGGGRGRGTGISEGDPAAPPVRERDWLQALDRHVMAPRAREAVDTLRQLTKPGQDEDAVLRAANAVEDVWDTLRHSTPTNSRR